jgi:pSer/pThr/pTyr-binding forkhead associated (FHA) protein
MGKVTIQVIDGVDKGKIFRDLPTPVTVGREEGNSLRLNDERISRFHLKIQADAGDFVLTDLDSTNGSRVNGHPSSIHRLQPGDCISIGRSTMLFGSNEEIAARLAALSTARSDTSTPSVGQKRGGEPTLPPTVVQSSQTAPADEDELQYDVNDPTQLISQHLLRRQKEVPPLPKSLSPSQAARLAEIFDHVHRALVLNGRPVQTNPDGTQITLDYGNWQHILALEMLLARYLRAVTDPDSWDESA